MNQVQQDKSQMKGQGAHHRGGHHGHKGVGGAQNQDDQSAQSIIAEGSTASASDIQSALSSMSPTDPNYATLTSMLVTAQSQQSAGMPGANLNFTA
jgi:hypothetical protein